MMFVSQKDKYALRAVFELARLRGKGPVKVGRVAQAQHIPPRFLEVILNELKRAGFVESRRGKEGGFLLVRDPDDLTVGDVLRFLQGAEGSGSGEQDAQAPADEGVLASLWRRADRAVSDVYDSTTFSDLVEEERQRALKYVPAYAI